MAANVAPKPPSFGLLTQTLIESPVVKWIIPARIRHSSKNDVVFVRDRSIQIKEIRKEGLQGEHSYLNDIAVKSDFDSTIRSARILGLPRKNAPSEPRPTGIDAIIKQEVTEPEPPDSEVELQPELPPQIIALTLDSMKLVFLCAFHKDREVRFLSSYRQLPASKAHSEQLGEHLAIDPNSRAMAVAANEGSFYFYALKHLVDLKKDVESANGFRSGHFDPVKGEKKFRVNGVILKMEFLYPSSDDTDNVILLLVTSEKTKTKIHCYEWDSSTHVSEAIELGRGQRLSDNQLLPLLLIPLKMSTAFMLVFERRIVTYIGVQLGHATPYIHELDHLEDAEEPGSSRARPVFTQWARPMRREDHVDNIYLCREDGVVRFLEISDELHGKIDSSHAAGRLKANINTAFAVLDLGCQYDDLLVAGGDMSDGGLWTFAPRRAPTQPMAKVPNWTPTIDFVAAHVLEDVTGQLGHAELMDGSARTQKRIFAPTGRGSGHGAITEVRFGIEASLLPDIVEIERGLDQMWVLPDRTGIYFLISYPTRTVSFTARPDDLMQDEDDELQIDTAAPTLAAALTDDGFIVQVTATTIRATKPGDPQRGLAIDLKNETILKATILGSLLLVAVKAADELSLRCAVIRTDEPEVSIQGLGQSHTLEVEPSCLSLQETQGEVIALVGTLAERLLIFKWDGSSLKQVHEHAFEGDYPVCNSIAMIQNDLRFWLVCGLRNGAVQALLLEGNGELTLVPQETFMMGNTPVSLITDDNNRKRVIVACGRTLCTLQYSSGTTSTSILNKIWITHKHLSGQAEVVAIAQPEIWIPHGSLGFADGHLFCVEDDKLRQIEISKASESHMIPWHINLDGTLSRIIYSKTLSRLIVLYTKTVIVRLAQRTGHHFRAGERSLQPVFGFLKPDEGLIRPDPGTQQRLHGWESKRLANIVPIQECERGETFLGMTEWLPTNGPKEFHFLVVNTMIAHRDRTPTGRLLFFALSNDQYGVTMTIKKAMSYKAPIYTVARYGASSLVYSCGNDIYLHRLDMDSGGPHWLDPVTFSLRSRGTHISVHMPLIFVTTATESLAVLRVEVEGDGDNRPSLVFHYSDEVARDGIFHLAIPEQGLILTSSKDCMVSGLWMPSERRISNSLITVFKADLPGSITRFRQLDRRTVPVEVSRDQLVDGRLTDPILGSTTDGTFYQMDILDEPSWRLLRFVVNMAKRHPIISPFRDTYDPANREAPKPHIEPSTEDKRHRHVDGDILVRLLQRGADQVLTEMLEREPGDDDRIVDFDTARARQERFQELMVDAGLGQHDPTFVIRWIRTLLASAL